MIAVEMFACATSGVLCYHAPHFVTCGIRLAEGRTTSIMSCSRVSLLGIWPPDLLPILLPISALVASLALLVCPTVAQTRNPFSAEPKAAQAGEFEFRINCALCHGLGARGGGRGPDLTRAHKSHGDSYRHLFRNITQGMPRTPIPSNTTKRQRVGITEQGILLN